MMGFCPGKPSDLPALTSIRVIPSDKTLSSRAIGLAGTYEHPAYTICRIESENGNLYFRYGVVRYQLHWDEQDILGIWKSDLVPEDYDVITLRFRDGDLLLNTGESTLWHCFKKQ